MSNPNFKTSICKYAYIGCKQPHKCWYAHNKEELRPRFCINGVNCGDKNCCYLHPNKNINKDEYYLKILLKSDILGVDKNNVKKQLDMISTKLIIEFDNDEINDYKTNNVINLNEKDSEDEDIEMKKYIEEFSKDWNEKPEIFYEKVDNKKTINIDIKANDFQIQTLLNYLKIMNIDFNIN